MRVYIYIKPVLRTVPTRAFLWDKRYPTPGDIRAQFHDDRFNRYSVKA